VSRALLQYACAATRVVMQSADVRHVTDRQTDRQTAAIMNARTACLMPVNSHVARATTTALLQRRHTQSPPKTPTLCLDGADVEL